MEQLTTYAERITAFLGLDGSYTVLGNTLNNYVLSIALFVIGLIVFAVLQKSILSWLAMLSKRTSTDLDDTFVKMVRSLKPPFYAFLSFWIATRTLELAGVADGIVTAILVIWLVYQAVIVVGILVEDVVFRHLAKDQDETTKSALHLLANIARAVMWVFGLLLVLSNFGIDITSLIAGAGIAGIAIAFALQGILSDLFSSFSIYFDKPFRVGDFIVAQDTAGTVKHVGVKSTRIQALSGEEVVLSNQELTSAKIQNYGQMEERRIAFPFGILYETPLDKVKEVPAMVQKVIESQENVRFDRAHFKSFGDSSLDFEVVYYVLNSDYAEYMSIQQAINLGLLEVFSKEGIEFAYPTRTLYINKTA